MTQDISLKKFEGQLFSDPKFNGPLLERLPLKSECQQESSKIRNKRQKCENPNPLKLRLLVVHVELFIDMWLISQIDFCFGVKWRY